MFALVEDDGLYRSPDGGQSWQTTGLIGNFSALALSPNFAADHTILAIRQSDGQLHHSVDGGQTWTTPALSLGSGGQHRLHFSPTFSRDSLILAANSQDAGAYRSTDGGQSWLPVGWHDPAQPYLGGFTGGPIFDLALAPDSAYDAAAFAGTSGGLYRSNNRGEHWTEANHGLAPLALSALAISPGEPATMLAGTRYFETLRFDSPTPSPQEGNLKRSIDGGQSWQTVSSRLARVQRIALSPNFLTDQTAFAVTGSIGQHGFFAGGVYRSIDGGQHWTDVFSNLAFYGLAISPDFATDRTLWVSAFDYSSARGIYHSTDGGDTWTPLAPSIAAQSLVASPNFALDQTLFAGTAISGLQKSTDGGLSWRPVLSGAITALTISPLYGASQTLYAAGHADLNAPGQIHRSLDGGETWRELQTGIPETDNGERRVISSLIFAADGSLLAGVSYGREMGGGAVYRSIDGGESWASLGGDLTATNVLSLGSHLGHKLAFFAGSDAGLWQQRVSQGGPAEPGTWISHGPRGGRGQVLALSPNYPADGLVFSGEWLTNFTGTEAGLGIIRSTDGGRTWQSSSRGTEGVRYSSALHAYAFSPDFTTDQTLFAGTGGGLFQSTDGGDSWTWLTGLYFGPPGSIIEVAVAPNYSNSGHMLAAGGYGGLYLSQDSGETWTLDPTISGPSDIAYSPDFALDQTIFVTGFDGLYRSSSGASSWQQVLTATVSTLALSPHYATEATLFAAGQRLHRSQDGGQTWTNLEIAPNTRITALAISPNFGAGDDTLFAGTTGGLYRSVDGGDNWEAVAPLAGESILSLALSPGWPAHAELLIGTARGVFRLGVGGSLIPPTSGLATLATGPLARSRDAALLIAGAPDHGLYGSTDEGQSWQPMGLQAGNSFYSIPAVAVSPTFAQDQTIFAAQQSSISIGANLYRTPDGGQTWDAIYNTDHIGGLALSPNFVADGAIFMTADGGRVLASGNRGDSWVEIGTWPGNRASLQHVALAPNYPADTTTFAGGSEGFWRLPPGNAPWQPATSGLDTERSVTSLAVSPNYPADQILLATATWFEAATSGQHHGVYRSVDGGQNWTPVNTGLPNTALQTTTFSPRYATDRTAYLTTTAGQLYRSIDGGQSWTLVGVAPDMPGLRGVVVQESGAVDVASEAGVWRYTTSMEDIMINGNFEAQSGWSSGNAPQPARYFEGLAYHGLYGMALGSINGPNSDTYSALRQQITLPANLESATLRYKIYPVSSEESLAKRAQVFPGDQIIGQTPRAKRIIGDAQYALLLPPTGGDILQTLFWSLSNAQSWQTQEFDLSAYAGQTVILHLGVYNNGTTGQTGMIVDEVSLLVQGRSEEPLTEVVYLPLVVR